MTNAELDSASGHAAATLVLAHGAGGHMEHATILELSQALCGAGFAVVRFNFPYRAKAGRRPPDRMPALQACYEAVLESLTDRHDLPLIIGGHSMGGRVASMLAADGAVQCDGLILCAYPLHPPGKPDRTRDEHLPRIGVPTLCLNGTRDKLCDPQVMAETLTPPHWRMHWLDGADHTYDVLKRSARKRDEIMREIGATAGAWWGRSRN